MVFKTQWTLKAGKFLNSFARNSPLKINTHPPAADPCNSATAPVARMMPNMSNRSLPGANKDGTDTADKPECILHPIESITGHRPDPEDETLFELRVQWENEPATWEPEYAIQQDAKETVFAYWDSVEGGRLGAMGDKDLWHPLKIEAHRLTDSGTIELETIWVGSPQRTWETEKYMDNIARKCVNDYWHSVGGRQKNLTTISVPATRGRVRVGKQTKAIGQRRRSARLQRSN